MAQPLKVSVTLTITLDDPAQWEDTFGVAGRANVRADVKSYLGNMVQQAGVFGNGEVQAEVEWS